LLTNSVTCVPLVVLPTQTGISLYSSVKYRITDSAFEHLIDFDRVMTSCANAVVLNRSAKVMIVLRIVVPLCVAWLVREVYPIRLVLPRKGRIKSELPVSQSFSRTFRNSSGRRTLESPEALENIGAI
jgi:hypothetical protein